MRTFYFFAILFFTCSFCLAQKPLTNSRSSSYYTYIYRLNDADMDRWYSSKKQEVDDRILTHPVDSALTDKFKIPVLAPGNYLKVYAKDNKLEYSLIENHSAFLKILDNRKDLRFILIDANGNEVNNAQVYLDHKQVPYDSGLHLFKTSAAKDGAVLKVVYMGVSNYYPTKQQQPGHSWLHDLAYSPAVKWIWSPFKKLFAHRPAYHNNYKYKAPMYNGYMVFNKPMYKPGDTVKFKAYIFKASTKRPVKQSTLYMRLTSNYGDEGGKIIGKVTSYREGAFESQFLLNDSLGISIDKNYRLSLFDSTENKAEDKRTALITGTFRYEDYELKAIRFSLRTDKDKHYPGSPVAVYFKATDENGLPVADGRVEVTLFTQQITDFHETSQFIPDTLWDHKLTLDAVGETKLMIPDSIFPRADLRYSLNAVFLNSNNEKQQQYKSLEYVYSKQQIITKFDNDTLRINYQFLGKDRSQRALLSTLNAKDDTIARAYIDLPAKILINPNVKGYHIKTDSTSANADLRDIRADISSSATRTADSLFIKVNNPRHIPFWYTVFSGNDIIDAGKAVDLFYQKAYRKNGNIFFRLNYIWGGEPRFDEVTISYRDKLLAINVAEPISVYPGQQVPIKITVKDPLGNPVPDADLTAMAVTGKFQNFSIPSVPYFGKLYGYRKMGSSLFIDNRGINGSWALNWKQWRSEMGLDSIRYFQFTHPSQVYQVQEPAPDSLTQIAPFVMKNGDVEPVHLLYIDERPVYFSQAQQLRRYSFAIEPGKHTLRFRTARQMITLENVKVDKGKKLILSLNADSAANHQAKYSKMPDSLTNYEADLISKYLIMVVDNFGFRMATLTEQSNIMLLNPSPNPYNNRRRVVIGPLPDNYAALNVKAGETRAFITEPGYSFEFLPGLIKQKSYGVRYPFDVHLNKVDNGITNYREYVLTANETDTLWRNFLDNRSHSTDLFHNGYVSPKGNGRLMIAVNRYNYRADMNLKMPFIRNVILYRNDNPDFIRIYPGNVTDFGYLEPGNYRMLFLFKQGRYFVKDSISIKPYGTCYWDPKFDHIRPADEVSRKIQIVIDGRAAGSDMDTDDGDKLSLKEAFNDRYTDVSSYSETMSGIVIASDDKKPLPGVLVIVKGTTIGTTTDIYGRFLLHVPGHGKLRIVYIGYQMAEIEIRPGKDAKVTLMPSETVLHEVVVTGYGSQAKRDLSGSVAGVLVGDPGAASQIFIRGINSIGNATPLYVVDGVISETGISGIAPGDIAEISVLKDAAATAIYGSRGANGVVMVTTKKSNGKAAAQDGQAEGQQQTMRSHFSDYAIWQPKLRTDGHGIANFTTTFPDDITNWRTLVIGVAGNMTGYVEGQIRSYKSLSANFVSPQFAVKGDKMSVIGKVMNYTTDDVTVNRTFTYNNQLIKQGSLTIKNALIDTFNVAAAGADSLQFEYTIKKKNGYFDGERRSIPVFEQGVLETKGTFNSLENDTTIALKFDPALGKIKLRAEASVLPALTEEAEHLRNYEYLCNEQLASKLKGLLAEKRIDKYLDQPFKWNKNITEIIKKLQENRRTEGTWGWWKDTDEELWISLHAVEALIDAEQEGYAIKLDKQRLIDYLVYQVTAYHGNNKLDAIELLFKLKAKADYPALIKAYEKQITPKTQLSGYEKMKLMAVKQQAGLKVAIDSLIKAKRQTMFGNCYWGEDNYNLFDNSVQLSVMAYHILKIDGSHLDLLHKLRNFFLEQRKTGYWRNTYESSLILETILPDVLVGGAAPKPSSITISGDRNETVTQFPYTAELGSKTVIRVSKTGALPVYLTGYQQFWNSDPVKVDKDFIVATTFEKNGDNKATLKGGEAVDLKAEVSVRADADFVMVEVPIPAGCSYESKDQPYNGYEVHREYFKNKVSIFCSKLKQGKYTFTIKLMPRYSGDYTLNPAKAEMMYFPVFYGREGMKRVKVN